MLEPNNSEVLLEWFKSNHRKEYDLLQDIAISSEKVFRGIRAPSPNMGEWPIYISASNNPDDPSKLTIGMNDAGRIFIGVMAKAILDSLTAEFEGLLSGEMGNKVLDKKVKEIVSQHMPINDLKTCSSCQAQNRPNASYCDSCGNPL